MPHIQHVTVTVPGEDQIPAVERFYLLLGGVPLTRPPDLEADTPGRWFAFGEVQLHLITGGPASEKAHFALDVGEDYDWLLHALDQAGIQIRPARNLWGGRRSFVRDPAGNLIEIFDRPPPSEPVE